MVSNSTIQHFRTGSVRILRLPRIMMTSFLPRHMAMLWRFRSVVTTIKLEAHKTLEIFVWAPLAWSFASGRVVVLYWDTTGYNQLTLQRTQCISHLFCCSQPQRQTNKNVCFVEGRQLNIPSVFVVDTFPVPSFQCLFSSWHFAAAKQPFFFDSWQARGETIAKQIGDHLSRPVLLICQLTIRWSVPNSVIPAWRDPLPKESISSNFTVIINDIFCGIRFRKLVASDVLCLYSFLWLRDLKSLPGECRPESNGLSDKPSVTGMHGCFVRPSLWAPAIATARRLAAGG